MTWLAIRVPPGVPPLAPQGHLARTEGVKCRMPTPEKVEPLHDKGRDDVSRSTVF